ncbi:MAG: PD40 domain-containing protein, partial [Planctomycetes bacterium]|nr:PD40 domain-containing protein [Planctomycetota bacterium]
ALEPPRTRADGAEPIAQAPAPASLQNPAFSPDGLRLLFTRFANGYNAGPAGLYRMPSAGGGAAPLLDEPDQDSVNLPGAAWNGATATIVFASDRGATRDEIWVIPAAGGAPRRVTRHADPLQYREPSFSPDGTWIVFEARDEVADAALGEPGRGSLWKVRADGAGLTRLTAGPAQGNDDRQPNWSPTGERIVFQRRRLGSDAWRLFTLAPDGTDVRALGAIAGTDASWSPDGRRIVFAAEAGGAGTENLWIVAATGGAPERLTTSAGADGAPSWSPDGAWVCFEAHDADESPAALWRIRVPAAPRVARRLDLPRAGRLYHGVFPGGASGEEDDLTPGDLSAYETAVGTRAAWVYFSNNWYRSRAFPRRTAEWIRDAGSVPYIRLMLRSDAEQNHAEPVFHPDAIARGAVDADFAAWARAAREFGSPVVVEWGTEMNGEWFSWNGRWNGAGETGGFGDPRRADGPERFVAAYRRLVGVMRGAGADNLLWVFHVNGEDVPDEAWNRLEAYYPGDDVVDWLGVSLYGPQSPTGEDPGAFRGRMDQVHARLRRCAPAKPIVVAEFGCAAGNRAVAAEAWAGSALADLLGGRWAGVVGFSWWNERWPNDDDERHDTTMRVQENAALRRVFAQEFAARAERIEQRPVAR